jgi:hypothetical protein
MDSIWQNSVSPGENSASLPSREERQIIEDSGIRFETGIFVLVHTPDLFEWPMRFGRDHFDDVITVSFDVCRRMILFHGYSMHRWSPVPRRRIKEFRVYLKRCNAMSPINYTFV